MPVETAPLLGERVSQFVMIILAGVIGAKLADRFNLPKILPLLVSGYILGPEVLNLLNPESIGVNFEVLANLLIPLILFNEGMHIEINYLRAYRWQILALATIGVIITMAGLGFIAHLLLKIDLLPAFLLGAVLAATDPGAVISITRGLEVLRPGAITVVEAESAFNDATSIVLTSMLIGLALGSQFSVLSFVSEFARLFFGGMLIGFGVGLMSVELITRLGLTEHMDYLSIVVFFAAWVIAEMPPFRTSGVTSVVIAGIVMAAYMESRLTYFEWRRVIDIWEHIAFLSEVLIFLVLGSYISVAIVRSYLLEALVITAAMMLLARPLAVYASTINSDLTSKEKWFIAAVGARGAIPAAMAGLAVSSKVFEANRIFGITMTAVVISLVAVSLIAKPVSVRTLGVRRLSPWVEKYYEKIAKLHSYRHVLRELDAMYRDGAIDLVTYNLLRREYEARYRTLEEELGDIDEIPEIRELREEELKIIKRRLQEVQLSALEELKSKSLIPTAVYEKVVKEITRRARPGAEEAEWSPIKSLGKAVISMLKGKGVRR